MKKILFSTTRSLIGVFFIIVLLAINSNAENIKIFQRSEGPPYIFTIQIDKVEKLAGMKLTITYPKKILQFQSARKMPSINSFMHVINDKQPGKLTFVMASAKGISGQSIELFDLTFSSLTQKLPADFKFEFNTCQLMNETLHEIPCNTSTEALLAK